MRIAQNGEARLVVMDVRSYEEQEETLAMLKMLTMGAHEIEQGRFRDAAQVFADLDKEDMKSLLARRVLRGAPY